jgi:transposase-like protein
LWRIEMSKQVEKGGRSSRSGADWERLLAAYEQRTVTREVFCAEAGVSPSTLDYWRKKLRDQGSASGGFIELVAGNEGERSCWDVELALGDGVVLRVARR